METRKDIVVGVCAYIWLLTNLICYFNFGGNGLLISNLVCITLFGSMVLVKLKNQKFNNWLNIKLKQK